MVYRRSVYHHTGWVKERGGYTADVWYSQKWSVGNSTTGIRDDAYGSVIDPSIFGFYSEVFTGNETGCDTRLLFIVGMRPKVWGHGLRT
jgi:hypothetical protein